MKNNKAIGILTCLALAVILSAFAMPVMAQGGDNHTVYGAVTFEGDNVTCNMTLEVVRTDATLETTCDETTGYTFELLNIAPNWAVGDVVDITANYTDDNGTFYEETQSLTLTDDFTQRVDFALGEVAPPAGISTTVWIAIFILIALVIVVVAVVVYKQQPE